MISINPNPSEEDSGSCYKLNFGALIKQSNSHKRAVLDYLRKVHFKQQLPPVAHTPTATDMDVKLLT